jgi:hypothetical protein
MDEKKNTSIQPGYIKNDPGEVWSRQFVGYRIRGIRALIQSMNASLVTQDIIAYQFERVGAVEYVARAVRLRCLFNSGNGQLFLHRARVPAEEKAFW